jgi:septin 3/9/12
MSQVSIQVPPNKREAYRLADFFYRTHLQDLVETTAQIHYEAFRSKQLLALKESSANKAHQPQSNGA